MTVADLGLRVDSSQAKAAATDLNALTAASDKAEAASARLDRATSKTNADIAKIAASVEKANAMLAKLVSVGEQTNAALAKMSTVAKTVTVEVEKLDRATGATATSVGVIAPAVQKNVKALNDNAAAAKLSGNQIAELGHIVRSIAGTLFYGGSAMQAFGYEANRIASVLTIGPSGVGGTLKAIGGLVLDVATKFPIATAAIAAAGTAFVAYETLGGSKIRSLDDILAEHEANIKRLGDAYDEVSQKQRKYASDTANTVNALNEKAAQDTRDLLATQIKAAQDGIFKQIGGGGGNQGALQTVIRSEFEPFAAAIQHLADESKKARPDLVLVRNEITDIAKADPTNLNSARDALFGLLDAASKTAAELPNTSQQVSALTDIVNQFNVKIAEVDSDPLRKALQDIFDKAKEGVAPIDQIMTELGKLEAANPSFDGIKAGFNDLIRAAYAASAAVDSVTPGGNGSPNGRQKLPVGILPDSAPTPDARPSVEEFYDRVAKANARAARAPDPYRDILKSAQDRIKQLRTELQLTGQVGVEADTLRNYQELLSRATDHGRSISKAQKDQLHDTAEEMAKLTEATKAAKLQQDLLFERQQMFRSPTEQDVYGTLRSAGIDIGSSQGQTIANQIRLNDTLKESKEFASDFVSTFTDGLRNGESAWQSFQDAAINALDKIANKLLEAGLNDLFGGSGGGSGILSLFGLGGSGGGFSAWDMAVADLGQGLYAKGGAFPNGISGFSNTVVNRPTPFFFAKGAGVMGEAGPEAIMPLRRGPDGKLGVAAANSNQPAHYNDNRVYHIDARGAQQGVGVEIQKALAAYDKGLPDRLEAINRSPWNR